jgi:pilus assembly protein CpaE
LTDLNMVTESRCVVLNFSDTRSGLSIADVEATIGTAVDLALPRSKATPASVNQGVPLLQSGVRDPMTAELRRLVARFGLDRPAAPQSKRAARKARAAAHKRGAGNRPRRAMSPFQRGKGVVA